MSAYLGGQGAKGSEKARKREKCERKTTALSGQQTPSHGRETPPTISHKDRPPKSLTPLRPPPKGVPQSSPYVIKPLLLAVIVPPAPPIPASTTRLPLPPGRLLALPWHSCPSTAHAGVPRQPALSRHGLASGLPTTPPVLPLPLSFHPPPSPPGRRFAMPWLRGKTSGHSTHSTLILHAILPPFPLCLFRPPLPFPPSFPPFVDPSRTRA